MTRPSADGSLELVYSPEWEARIYLTGLRDWDIWAALPGLQVPALILRGAQSDTFLPSAVRLTRRRNPAIQLIALENATHLLPMEKPQEIFQATHAFLKEVL